MPREPSHRSQISAGIAIIIVLIAIVAIVLLIRYKPPVSIPLDPNAQMQLAELLAGDKTLAIIPPSTPLIPAGETAEFLVGIRNPTTTPISRYLWIGATQQGQTTRTSWFAYTPVLHMAPSGTNQTSVSLTIPQTAIGPYTIQVLVCSGPCEPNADTLLETKKFGISVEA
ncbi:MAG: hypothetical protein KKA90_05125 [Nanoarchaeota archaeon]|nr:hypothetical protein [Nanoarchaeota archaeon]